MNDAMDDAMYIDHGRRIGIVHGQGHGVDHGRN